MLFPQSRRLKHTHLQVLTKALQLHPAASGLWSYAAAWEFEHNSNAAAARMLMQRGLRMCKASRQLWLEYFRMELMYAHKLRTRRHILGLDALPGVAPTSLPSLPLYTSSTGSEDAPWELLRPEGGPMQKTTGLVLHTTAALCFT